MSKWRAGTPLLTLPKHSSLFKVSLTIALPLQALLVNEWLRTLLYPMFEAAFIAAVAMVAWFCGLRHAIAALAFSTALLVYFFLPPYYSLVIMDTATVVKLVLFLAANVVTVGLIANLYRTRAELVTSEQLHRNLAELIPLGGWVSDRQGNMQSVSESFLNAFGTTQEECSGVGWTRFLEPEQRDIVVAEWQECLRSSYFWDYEYRMRAPSGQCYVVLSRGVPVRDERGRVRSWVGIHLDITERERGIDERVKQARDIARFNAELEQLAYASAHDLQEPLRMIASYLQLLQRRYKGKLDAEADEFIQYAVDGADRLKALLHDLLMLQQIGKGGRERAVVPLAELVNRAVRNLGSTAEGAEIECGPLPSSCVDAHEFVQLFEHLIGNAIKYVSPGATPRVSITAEDSIEGKVVTVRDNGIGIEKDYVRKVFDVFQRLHARSEYPGTGIGLAICRKVVEVHGGRIWVESEPGAGSTFRFTVPEAA